MFSGGVGWGAAQNSLIKSIQEVEIAIAAAATSNTATLGTTVDKNKSIILWNGTRLSAATNDGAQTDCRVELTNGTTVTAYVTATGGTAIRTVRATVVEFYPFVCDDVSHGTITIANGQFNNIGNLANNISSSARACHIYLGANSSVTGDAQRINSRFAYVDFASFGSPTSLGAYRGGTSGTLTVGYCVVNFRPGILASRQRALVSLNNSLTGSASFSSVVLANTLSIWGGSSYGDGFTPAEIYGFHTNATTFDCTRLQTTVNANYQVTLLEFMPKWVKGGKQQAAANFAFPNLTVDTALSPAVVLGKTLLSNLHHSGPNPFSNVEYTMPTTKTNTTTQNRCERGSGGFANTNPTVQSFEEFEFR